MLMRGRNAPQGEFHVKRHVSGGVYIRCPGEFVVSPMLAVEIAKSILKQAGVETVLAEPGQTVIRPPGRPTKRLFPVPDFPTKENGSG